MPSKKDAQKVTSAHSGGRGVKNLLFYFIKKGTHLIGGRDQNIFVTIPMIRYLCASVSMEINTISIR